MLCLRFFVEYTYTSKIRNTKGKLTPPSITKVLKIYERIARHQKMGVCFEPPHAVASDGNVWSVGTKNPPTPALWLFELRRVTLRLEWMLNQSVSHPPPNILLIKSIIEYSDIDSIEVENASFIFQSLSSHGLEYHAEKEGIFGSCSVRDLSTAT